MWWALAIGASGYAAATFELSRDGSIGSLSGNGQTWRRRGESNTVASARKSSSDGNPKNVLAQVIAGQ